MRKRWRATGRISRIVPGLCGVFAMAWSSWAGPVGEMAMGLTLSKPMPYQVVQRDEHDQGRILIQGTWLALGDGVTGTVLR